MKFIYEEKCFWWHVIIVSIELVWQWNEWLEKKGGHERGENPNSLFFSTLSINLYKTKQNKEAFVGFPPSNLFRAANFPLEL